MKPARRFRGTGTSAGLTPPLLNDEREFRIIPRRPPPAAESRVSAPPALGRIYSIARNTVSSATWTKPARHYRQRCAVRATYVANRTAGQWKAHGRYLSRESATHKATQRQAGFDERHDKLDLAHRLDEWQQAGDRRLWKIILSPEFGDKLDMQQLARGVMARLQADLGAGVEWMAVAHYNTGHPHVHVVMRGIDLQGREIRLAREFVKHGIRDIAENWCTEVLGHRTRTQALEAQRREVGEARYTSLDRIIARADAGIAEGTYFPITCPDGARTQLVVARLAALEEMGLASRVTADTWQVRRDFEGVLRGMQRMADRQRTLASGGALRSDERLPIQPLDHHALEYVEGRILAHGEKENGRSYMMLESTDAKVYAIDHTRQMQELRGAGGLRVNAFVRLEKVFGGGRPKITVEELGTADSILENRGYLRQAAKRVASKGATPSEQDWAGWLGRYQHALNRAANEFRSEDRGLGIGE